MSIQRAARADAGAILLRTLGRVPAWTGYFLWSIVIAAMVLRSPNFVPASGLRRTILGGDFMQFYLAGTLLREGYGGRLYDLQFQQQFQLRPDWLPFQWEDGAVSLFIYPPQVALFFEPFAWLPFPAALLVWTFLAVAFFLGWFEVTLRAFPALRPYRGGMLLLLLLFMPLVHAIYSAQNSTLSLLLVGLSTVLLKRGKDLTAGACLALLAFKPQLVPLYLLVALLQRRLRFVGGFLCAGAVMALAVLVRAPELFGGYVGAIRALPDWILMPGMPTQNMSCLHGFWFNLLGATRIGEVRILTWASSAIVVGAVAARVVRVPGDPVGSWRVATLGALLVSPHLLHYDLTILLAPAFASFGDEGRVRYLSPLLVLSAAIISPWVATHTGIQLVVVAMICWLVNECLTGREGNVARRDSSEDPSAVWSGTTS